MKHTIKDKPIAVKLDPIDWGWIRIAVMDGIEAYEKAGFPTIAAEIQSALKRLRKQAPASKV